MDFGASTAGFEARLCHIIFYLFGIECCYSTKILATATHPTLLWAPIFHQQEDEDWTVSLSSMQGVFAESSLRKQAWRNPKEGRVGCLHQDIFTRKVTDIAFTSNFCNNYSHPASPASMYLTSPRPRPTLPRPILPHVPYLMSSSPLSRVPKSQVPSPHTLVPMPPSPCTRPTFIHSLLFLTRESVSRYKQPLRLCMRNKILRSANVEINKGDLPLMYSWGFWLEFINLVGFFLAGIVWRPVTALAIMKRVTGVKQ